MLITEIKSKNNINMYNVDIIIVPTIFSSYSDVVFSLDELNMFKDKEIALKIDKIIEEDELIFLENYIKESIVYNIKYYIFTDMSVYYILKKYNLENKSMFFAKTINCSTYDIIEYNKLGIKCLVSTELMIDDLVKISNLENNIIYTYGYFNIFYSRRELLSLYKEYSNLNYNSKNKMYTLLEETRNEFYPVVENNNGTFIHSAYKLMLFDEIFLLNKNNYFYIDSVFIDEKQLLEIINIYSLLFKTGYSKDLENELIKIDNNIGKSFLYKKPEILKEND